LSQVGVAQATGLANSSICRFELGQIPYYTGKTVLDRYYRGLELERMKLMILSYRDIAYRLLEEKIAGTSTEEPPDSKDHLKGTIRRRMREIFELHRQDFFRLYNKMWLREDGANL
jgi:hypothetical protein